MWHINRVSHITPFRQKIKTKFNLRLTIWNSQHHDIPDAMPEFICGGVQPLYEFGDTQRPQYIKNAERVYQEVAVLSRAFYLFFENGFTKSTFLFLNSD